MFTLGLTRLDTADNHLGAFGRGDELEPALPHAVGRFAPDRSCQVAIDAVVDRGIERPQHFSHIPARSDVQRCNAAASQRAITISPVTGVPAGENSGSSRISPSTSSPIGRTRIVSPVIVTSRKWAESDHDWVCAASKSLGEPFRSLLPAPVTK